MRQCTNHSRLARFSVLRESGTRASGPLPRCRRLPTTYFPNRRCPRGNGVDFNEEPAYPGLSCLSISCAPRLFGLSPSVCLWPASCCTLMEKFVETFVMGASPRMPLRISHAAIRMLGPTIPHPNQTIKTPRRNIAATRTLRFTFPYSNRTGAFAPIFSLALW